MKLKKTKTFLRNIIRKERQDFYLGLMFPKDDYYLRYFGHQYGKAKRKTLTGIFPQISEIKNITIKNYFDLVSGTSLEVNELVVLVLLARFCGARDICEIGTFNGNTALNLAVNIPESRIITIDLPPDYQRDLPRIPTGNSNVTDSKKVGKCFIGTTYEGKNIRQVYANSYDLDWGSFNTNFDLIFIDGCHHYIYVKKDSENALRYLKDDGIIIWHDYGQQVGVSSVVDELGDFMRIYAIRGTRFAVGFKTAANGLTNDC